MSRQAEFGVGHTREVTWDHVEAAHVGPHGPWNGGGGDDVHDAVETQLGHYAHEPSVRWTHERVPVAALKSSVVDEYAKPCSCGQAKDCPSCYSKVAAQHGPPITVVQNADGEMHAPDGRHRLAGAVALGRSHVEAFVARSRA